MTYVCDICTKQMGSARSLTSHKVGAHNPNVRKGLLAGRGPKSEDTKAKISKAHVKLWQDPAFKERAEKILRDPERVSRRISKRNKTMWGRPEYREERAKQSSCRMKRL